MSHNEESNSITGAMAQTVLLGKRREDITELSKILLLKSSNNPSLDVEGVTAVLGLRHFPALMRKY